MKIVTFSKDEDIILLYDEKNREQYVIRRCQNQSGTDEYMVLSNVPDQNIISSITSFT